MDERFIRDISDFIFVCDRPQKADIIFLPGGSDPAIPEHGAQLYSLGYAPRLLPSGGVSVKIGRFNGVKRKRELYSGDYATDCAFYVDVLRKNGVPDSAIVTEDRSGFTKENAFFSRQATDRSGLSVRKAIVCCKSFHARRCLMMYALAFPEAELLVCPTDAYGISKDTWFLSEAGIDRVLGELARCGSQMNDEIRQQFHPI